ncbi:MAG: glycine cleavage system protein GcvH [Candidatus Aminicenantes bacterium]|nr:glycine cleavage system protein GcvH [Candidatus Aminicenantes bacterium]
MYPEDCLYTKEHEWIKVKGNIGVIGITDYAQESLGDIVFIDLPEVGEKYDAGDPFGTVESVKAVSDIYTPVTGEVVEVNERLKEGPEKLNEDPYGEAWLIKIKVASPQELDGLLKAEEYAEYIKEEAKK